MCLKCSWEQAHHWHWHSNAILFSWLNEIWNKLESNKAFSCKPLPEVWLISSIIIRHFILTAFHATARSPLLVLCLHLFPTLAGHLWWEGCVVSLITAIHYTQTRMSASNMLSYQLITSVLLLRQKGPRNEISRNQRLIKSEALSGS